MADEIIFNPSTTSSDYDSMIDYWEKVDTLLGGVDALREAGQTYLPMFPDEPQALYNFRLEQSVLTNVYKDVAENLANKPFAKKVRFVEGKASPDIETLGEDIDGRGNNLHVFLWDTFFNGINNAIDWILVDKMPMRPGASQAEERLAGARPYWVHVPAKNMLAVYSAIIKGKEQIIHARIHEPEIVRDGWTEILINRVRVFDRPFDEISKTYGPAVWEVWEEEIVVAGAGNSKDKTVWSKKSEGKIAIGVIALVPYVTGRRQGTSWVFSPALRDAVDSQMDHYQQENGLKDIKTMTCYPMLSGSGVTPEKDAQGNNRRVPVGPRAVLFAPMDSSGKAGEWKWIEINASSLTFLAGDLKKKEDQIRELGRAPLTAQSVGLTVVTSSYASQKANSAVQAWAFGLKDAAEQAFKFTSMYLGGTESPEVWIYTDFPTESATEQAPRIIMDLRKAGEISRIAMFEELKRFNIVSPDYDAEADEEVIAEEAPEDPTLADVTGALNLDPNNPDLTPEQRAQLAASQRPKPRAVA